MTGSCKGPILESTAVHLCSLIVIFSPRAFSLFKQLLGLCDIQNNQDLGKSYQPSASADNLYLDLDYSR